MATSLNPGDARGRLAAPRADDAGRYRSIGAAWRIVEAAGGLTTVTVICDSMGGEMVGEMVGKWLVKWLVNDVWFNGWLNGWFIAG